MTNVDHSPTVDDDPYLEQQQQQPSANKYKYKYSNRKKMERHKQSETWPPEASSSEDTTGSTERSSHSPEMCSNKRDSCDETEKMDNSPNRKEEIEDFGGELRCENSVCGRGARRISKKSGCSCCNGAGDLIATSRKRTAPQLHMQAPHKKAILNKKR